MRGVEGEESWAGVVPASKSAISRPVFPFFLPRNMFIARAACTFDHPCGDRLVEGRAVTVLPGLGGKKLSNRLGSVVVSLFFLKPYRFL